jgi:xylose isomerase
MESGSGKNGSKTSMKPGGTMPDYWIKITEREDEDLRHHHYLIAAKDEREARKIALKFMERFIDDDENPEKIEDGYAFYNNAILVKLADVKETTKEQFKEFLLKTHTINLT